MIDVIREASTLQFVSGVVAFVAGVMIVLQATLNRRVWSGYLWAFFGALIVLAVTLR